MAGDDGVGRGKAQGSRGGPVMPCSCRNAGWASLRKEAPAIQEVVVDAGSKTSGLLRRSAPRIDGEGGLDGQLPQPCPPCPLNHIPLDGLPNIR